MSTFFLDYFRALKCIRSLGGQDTTPSLVLLSLFSSDCFSVKHTDAALTERKTQPGLHTFTFTPPLEE